MWCLSRLARNSNRTSSFSQSPFPAYRPAAPHGQGPGWKAAFPRRRTGFFLPLPPQFREVGGKECGWTQRGRSGGEGRKTTLTSVKGPEETLESKILAKNEHRASEPNGVRKDKNYQGMSGPGGHLYFRSLRSRLCSGRRGSREESVRSGEAGTRRTVFPPAANGTA